MSERGAAGKWDELVSDRRLLLDVPEAASEQKLPVRLWQPDASRCLPLLRLRSMVLPASVDAALHAGALQAGARHLQHIPVL